MTDQPLNLKRSAAELLGVAARAIVTSRRGFTALIDQVKAHGLEDVDIRQICADAGLSWPDVRALLDETPEVTR